MTTLNLQEAAALVASLDRLDVPRSRQLDKVLATAETVQTFTLPEPERVADLKAADLERLLVRTAIAWDPRLVDSAKGAIRTRLEVEAADALRDHVPAICKALAPTFAEAAGKVWTAAQTGIRPNMSANDVIDLDSGDAIAAYRELVPAFTTLSTIADIRINLCRMLDLAPSLTPSQLAIGGTVDYTTLFTHPDLGIAGGYRGSSPWRWLSLAIFTNGRMTLNDDETVRRILGADLDSPGWVVCAGSCVVTDDDARQLHLYTDDWIPTWVDDDQLAHLVDKGLVIAARPDAVRPPDRRPYGSEPMAGATR